MLPVALLPNTQQAAYSQQSWELVVTGRNDSELLTRLKMLIKSVFAALTPSPHGSQEGALADQALR